MSRMIHASASRDGGNVSVRLHGPGLDAEFSVSRAGALAFARIVEASARDQKEEDAYEASFEWRDG